MLFLGLLFSCTKRELKLTPEQVSEIIDKELPNGSTKEQVINFLDSKGITGFEIVRGEYKQGQPVGTDAPEDKASAVKGYIAALIKDVGSDSTVFATYHIRVLFYFGEGEQLIGHKDFIIGTH